MIDHGDKPRPGDVKDFMSGLATGFEALAKARDQIGAGSSSPLEKPIEDSFGRFTERKDFAEGCNIGDEITRNGRAVCFTTTDGDVVRDVEIGKTPLQYDPKKGGESLAGAGDASDFLLAIKKRDTRTGTEVSSLRYVTEAEIKGVAVRNGQGNLSLKPDIKSISSLAKGEVRQIVIQGQVHGVHALR